VRQDEEQQFREYVGARGPALLRLAVGIAGERYAGEDLLQAALAKVVVHWAAVNRAEDRDAYVRRIIVTTHLSQARRKRVREVLTFNLPERGSAWTSGIEDRQLLLPALARLGPKQRAVVVLRYYEDRPDEEIARLLGCSTATVRSQAMRALAALREAPELTVMLGEPR
jgi:RNA polymerase sigma-70 factor (sigma-E family)